MLFPPRQVITKDTNVMLVGIGCKCMAMLAKGLKKKFQPFAVNCLSALLEKFKEKKQNVVTNLRDAVDAIYDSVSMMWYCVSQILKTASK
jgi:cytoskeleton-associated protein 5